MPRKPKLNYSTEVGMNGKDLFQTPRYATELLIPYIPKEVNFIWECAAGEGRMVEVFEEYGYEVLATDIQGKYRSSYYDFNFLTGINPLFDVPKGDHPAIITNPPFSLKKKFFFRCIEYNIPFALLIPFDFNAWLCEAFDKYDCQGLVPSRRIDYITPNNKKSRSQFHSFWLTRYFNLPKQLTIVELTKQMKENI